MCPSLSPKGFFSGCLLAWRPLSSDACTTQCVPNGGPVLKMSVFGDPPPPSVCHTRANERCTHERTRLSTLHKQHHCPRNTRRFVFLVWLGQWGGKGVFISAAPSPKLSQVLTPPSPPRCPLQILTEPGRAVFGGLVGSQPSLLDILTSWSPSATL